MNTPTIEDILRTKKEYDDMFNRSREEIDEEEERINMELFEKEMAKD